MKEKQTLEQSLARLEEIVSLLADEQVDLSRSLELFSEGVKLSETCRNELLEAKQLVEEHLAGRKQPEPGDGNE